MDVKRLEGKTAVVTGAASGIGLATVRALAGRGASVAICDVDEGVLARAAAELGDKLVASRVVDVSDKAQVKGFADEVIAKGTPHIVINNAGIGVAGMMHEVPLDEWDRVIGVNLCGVAYGCHAFIPSMIASGRGGHIVNIASMAGFMAGAGMASYHASKFGVVGLSESLRLELRDHGIGVTAVCPGLIRTPIAEKAKSFGQAARPQLRDKALKLFEEKGRPPEVVAEAILKAIHKDVAVAPVTVEAKTAYWLRRLSPGVVERVLLAVTRRTQREL